MQNKAKDAKPASTAKPAQKTPSNAAKKRDMISKASEALKTARAKALERAKANKQYYLDSAKKHREEFDKCQKHLVDGAREAKKNNSFFVPQQSKYFFVIRIKGLNRVPPKEKKILRLFRLRQLNNGVFVRNNKATMNMLRRIEPYVTYGCPTYASIRKLIYKRGYGKLNEQRIPLTNNEIVAQKLGEYNIKSVEDLIHEIWSCGPHFKEANAFLWPFKLDSPRGGLKSKRHQFMIGGDFGPREELINPLINAML